MGEPTETPKGPYSSGEYYELTRDIGASLSLQRAMQYVENHSSALDLGSGSGRDSLYLLGSGFSHVTSVDKEALAAEVTQRIPQGARGRLEFVQSKFDEYDFGLERFDLINAHFSLPFNPPQTFDEMFGRLKVSLVPGGVFVGIFYGDRDEWNGPGTKMTFHTREQLEALLADLEVVSLDQEDNLNGKLANGAPKHWHNFTVIARKPH